MKLIVVAIGLACILPALSQESSTRNLRRNPFLPCKKTKQGAMPTLSKNPFLPDIPATFRPKITVKPKAGPLLRNPFLPINTSTDPSIYSYVGPITPSPGGSPKSCRGPDLLDGVCTPLLSCQPLATKLQQNQSNATFFDSLLKSYEICGSMENSVVCCPYVNQNQFQQNRMPTTLPTIVQPETKPVIVHIGPITPSPGKSPKSCKGPDLLDGFCTPLSNCPQLLRKLKQNPSNEPFIDFLRQSNAICDNVKYSVVCCPYLDDNPRISWPNPLGPIVEPKAGPLLRNPLLPTNTSPSRSPTSCRGPDLLDGVCTPLLSCQPLLTRLQENRSNATFIDFLRKSNEICGNKEYSVVCCPSANQDQFQQIRMPTTLPTMEEGCGYVNRSTNGSEEGTVHIQVVGGVESPIRAWPWIALIGYNDSLSSSTFKCGGALITSQHVLSAAHCIRSDLAFVRLGEHDLSTDTESNHIDVPVRKVLRHPQYSRIDGRNDIALLYLSQNVASSETISPVCLPTTPELRTKSFVDFSPFVAGWGRTQEGGKSATVLQELQIPIHNNSVCVDLYRKQKLLISEQQFDDSVICAGVLSGGKDTCQGDSGGPLMVPVQLQLQTHYHMVGIVSYSIGCARKDVLGAYTRVANFIDWIQVGLADTM